jgi:hypothetical protein
MALTNEERALALGEVTSRLLSVCASNTPRSDLPTMFATHCLINGDGQS